MKKEVLTTILLITLSLGISAQKVGLVLSGGGAKGIAHIGVIRILEENNIPIDYITGTSMGAIVGGLYAAGYTPDEMEALFRSEDFYFWSTGTIQEEYRYYFKKQEDSPDWIELKMDRKKDKLKLLPPTNIIPQEQMDFAFMQLMSPTNAVCNYNFDRLLVPYRCVATDVYKNKPVILEKGDLGEAIRASMTVPLYFKPITIDSILMFDGGIVNNFPHDVMKNEFHPDIIIGHKVANAVGAAEADDLLEQISNMVMRPTDYNIDPKDGILLETKFSNVSLLDFKKIDFIENEGVKTANALIDSIKSRISRRVTKDAVDKRRMEFNSRKPRLLFKNIQVEGAADPTQQKFIIQSIRHNQNVVTLDQFKKEYFKLVADEQIKSIRPTAYYNRETGYFDLNLKLETEKTFDIRVGGNLSSKPANMGFASFDYRLFRDVSYTLSSNLYFGRFYSSVKLGTRMDFPTRLPLYLSGNLTFNRWDYFSSSSDLFFENVRPPFIIRNEGNFRLEGGFPLGVHNKVVSGLSYSGAVDEYYQIEKYNKEDTPDKTNFNAVSLYTGFESNSRNYIQFATEGIFNSVSFKYIIGNESNIPGSTSKNLVRTDNSHNFYQIKALNDKYYKLTRRLVLGTRFEGVYSNKKPFSNYTSTLLSAPGFNPTPHSQTIYLGNYRADKYLAGGLKTIFKFNSQFHFRLEGYAFAPIHEIYSDTNMKAISDPAFFNHLYFQGLGALVYQTGIGPVDIELNYYDKSNSKFYFCVNFGYILFNKRGF